MVALFLLVAAFSWSQKGDFSKMSGMIRQLALDGHLSRKRVPARHGEAEVCAFVRIEGDGESVLKRHGGRKLEQMGSIYVAAIPIGRLASLSVEPQVARIEASRSHSLHNDSMAIHINALPIYAGNGLPQAFTGRGVVMGVMDIGFDLTHPTFYDASATTYRIRRFWDQLSLDTIGSNLYVGAEYTDEAAIKDYAHSRDGLLQTHGTHTAGTAAGSGYDSPYRGIAYESDIALVSNAVSEDIALIDSVDLYKYTYATDALGFKYLFDYARSVGQPCVVSFSEGSYQDFRGDDVLFYEMLDSLIGPGCLLVASAGNEGRKKTYFRKPAGTASMGSFVYSSGKRISGSAKSALSFAIRTIFYGQQQQMKITVPTSEVLACPDSVYTDTLFVDGQRYTLAIVGYPSCYDTSETVFDLIIEGTEREMGGRVPISVEIVGETADVEYFKGAGYLLTHTLNEQLNAGETSHSIHSPGSAPRVICVGATGYRTGVWNYLGEYQAYDLGNDGRRSTYSSIGPTYDGRIKPDVMAPGTNVISAYSSYYLEHNPDAADINSDVSHFSFNGRTYAWNCNSGTSMATPAVAGTLALWLQACPTLTPEEVLAVFARTCSRYDTSLAYPNNLYGYGQIDAYRGLLDILNLDGIEDISHRHTPARIIVHRESRRVTLSVDHPLPSPFTVRIYSADGRRLLTLPQTAGRTSYELDLSCLSSGIFVLQFDGHALIAGSTLIRI